MIKDEVRNCRGYEEAVCGVVLTGGVPLLRGFDRISEVVLGMPVRIGAPPVQGLPPVAEAPQLATAMGLITYDYVPGVPETAGPEATSGFFRSITDRIKGLIGNMNPNIEARKEGGILCLKSKR
jgi:cell division ATPase FtsA